MKVRKTGKKTVKQVDDDPIGLMYHALLLIGCVSSALLGETEALRRIHVITDRTLIRMNTEHTKKVQKILGIR